MAGEIVHRRGAEDAEFAEKELTDSILAAAIEVHRWLGPGLLESIYQVSLQHELSLRGVPFRSQVVVPLNYKGRALAGSLRIDLLVDDAVIVEIKAVNALDDIHRAQLLSYLRLLGRQTGLLINFNVPLLKHGIKRVVNSSYPSASSASSAPSAPSAPLR